MQLRDVDREDVGVFAAGRALAGDDGGRDRRPPGRVVRDAALQHLDASLRGEVSMRSRSSLMREGTHRRLLGLEAVELAKADKDNLQSRCATLTLGQLLAASCE